MIEEFNATELHNLQSKIPAFLIESTAPINIDDHKDRNKPTSSNEILENVAKAIAKCDKPTLVISVHGFNNEETYIKERYKQSFQMVNDDCKIPSGKIVCIGYRWPSEKVSFTKYLNLDALQVCIGYHETEQAYGGEAGLNTECEKFQIKVLLNS